MQNKKMKRLGALLLAAALTMSSFGHMTMVQAEEAVTQMASDKEIVYMNSYGDDAREQNFDSNWKFYLGDATGAEATGFDDSSWRTVNVPHDYSIEQEFTAAGEAESAYLLGGTGWYRKHFTLSSELEGKEIRIDFGGVYMNATVWVNGTQLGTHPYGYTPFSFDITDYVSFTKENVITVKVDHKTPSSRWYSGSGIYRSVYLTVMDEVHVDLYGTQITTPNLETEKGGTVNMTVKTTVANEGTEAKDVVLVHTIYEKGTKNSIGTVTTTAESVAAGSKAEITAILPATNPELWDTENPNLYTVVTEVKVGGAVVDTYETEYGFRYFKFDTNTGFYLNGEKMKLKGVCMHHDQGSLGAEAHYRAIERQVEIVQEMGCNSIRVTHNPAADELIEICNEKGILVIDEFFDGWHIAKNGNIFDYSTAFSEEIEKGNEILGAEDGMTWAEFDLKATIGRGENSPAVIMWSLGNEIQEGAGGSGYSAVADNLIAWAKETGTTKLLTVGSNQVKNVIGNSSDEQIQVAEKVTAAGGVSGTNYSGGASYDSMHNTYQNWFIYGSETASHVNSRGVYDVIGSRELNQDKALTSYDYSAVSWGATASSAWYDVITRDFVAGEYVWTGFDYLGEPTPNNGTDAGWKNGEDSPKNSFFGIVDTAGLPKDNYYFYQSQWNDDVTTLHVLPAWNSDVVYTGDSRGVPVVVYSDAKSVNLTLTKADGTEQDLGTKTFETKRSDTGLYTYQMYEGSDKEAITDRNMYLTWYVPFQEGTLTATAYDAAGNVITDTVGRSFVKTTGDEAKLVATVDRDTIDADGKDLAYITVDVTDEKGNIVPDAKNNVKFTVEGEGVLVGVDNGKQSDHQSYQDDNRDAFSGSLVAIVQSTKTAGQFTVTASAEGLTPASVTVTTTDVGAQPDVTFNMSKNYYVKVGTAPQLPAVIETKVANGEPAELSVVWEEIPAESYATAGTFAVAGLVDGKYDVAVTINMIDEVGGLLNYSTVTPVGMIPTLPENRPAVMLDGTILSAAFAVDWDDITEADVAEEGTFVVDGTADVLGNKVAVTATVRVQEAKLTIGESISYQAAEVTQDIPEEYQSDSLEAIYDGATAKVNVQSGPNTSIWSNYDSSMPVNFREGESGLGDNTAEVVFRYDTAQNFGKIVIHFTEDGWATAYPDPNTTKIYFSVDGVNFELLDTTETIGEASNSVKPYTYTFEPTSAEKLKFVFENSTTASKSSGFTCTSITEIELMKAVNDAIEANTATGLSELKVNDVDVSEAELATNEYYTLDKTAEVSAKGKDNAAVTVLPVYEDKILIITESEDHTSRDVFEIFLNAERPKTDADGNIRPEYMTVYGENHHDLDHATEGNPDYVKDGDPNTIWHTEWKDTSRDTHYLIFTFDEAMEISGMRFMQRNGTNGRVRTFDLYVRADESAEWTPVLTEQSLEAHAKWQLVTFEPVNAKQVKFQVVDADSDGDNKYAAAAEVRFTVPADKTALQGVIDSVNDFVKTDYTEESWNSFQEALTAAIEVNAKESATQEEVDEAAADLTAAIKALVKVTTPDPEPEQPKAGWVKDANGWWYRNADGTWPANSWKQIGGEWYWFGSDGYMKTGWLYSQGEWYYLSASGAMATGWVQVGSTWYYLEASGAMATGWIQVGSTWYYLKADGSMATGWIQVGSTWYYLKADGSMATGWIQVGSTWYYLNASGAMQTGWLQQGSTWYYLKADGSMAVGKLKIDNRMNSFASSGAWLGYI